MRMDMLATIANIGEVRLSVHFERESPCGCRGTSTTISIESLLDGPLLNKHCSEDVDIASLIHNDSSLSLPFGH